jgi:carbon storage regulator
MLVLSRKKGEQIMIGDGDKVITITLVDIDRGKIRLGFEAPKDVTVLRKELYDKKRQKLTDELPPTLLVSDRYSD